MSAIFISHSSRDNAVAGELKARLAGQGHRSVFLDFDPEDGIPTGRDWERELYARLRGCQAVIVLCSEHSMASRWCFAEIAFARSLGKALLPLKIGDCTIPAAFTDVQKVDLRADPEAGYRRLWAGLRQAGLDPAAMFDWDGSRPPYPGLMVFQEQDAAIYFGRGAEIQATVEKLNRMQRLGDGQFAMILGASGSGKSSLLRAGVLPRLKRDRDRWLVPGVFRPLGQPFERLATMLSAAFKGAGVERPWQEIRERLAQPAAKDAAVDMVELATDLRAASGQREATLLLGVDQFEELLAPGEGDAAERFLSLLRALTDVRNSGVIAIGTLRSDFLGSFQNHDAIRGTPYEPVDLPKFPIEAFSEVIEGPARIASLELEPGLATAIVADAATDDALPLLAFALRELWEARGAEGGLTIERYRNGLGGLQGSVAKAADALYPKTFTTREEERDVRFAFLSMVRVDVGGAYVRKPTRWSALPQSAHGLLERFVQGRLLVSRGEGMDRILEVAHEALIRRWDKLRGWVEEDREFLRTRERIEVAAGRWLEAGRDVSLLLPRGRPLAEAQDILVARRTDLAPDIVAFIEGSVAAKRAQDEQERKVQQQLVDAAHERETAARRLARRTRMAAIGIGMLAAVAVGFGWYAIRQANEAARQSAVAVQQKQAALARQLAAQAEMAYDESANGLEMSALLAAESLKREWSPQAFRVLSRAMELLSHRPQGQFAGVPAPISALAFSSDGTQLAVGSNDGTVSMRKFPTGERVDEFQLPTSIRTIAFSPDNQTIAIGGDYRTWIWNIGSRQSLPPFSSRGSTDSVAFARDGRLLAVASEEYATQLFDTINGVEMQPLESDQFSRVRAVAFHPDKDWLITEAVGTLSVWSLVDRKRVASAPTTQSGRFVALNSTSIATADGVRSILQAPDGTVTLGESWMPTRAGMQLAALSHDGGYLATLEEDGTVRQWELSARREKARLVHNADVAAIAFSPDSQWLVTADENVNVWMAGDGSEFARLVHDEAVTAVAFSLDSRWLATWSGDNYVRVFDAASWREVFRKKYDVSVSHVSFSPDNRWVAVVSGSLVTILDVETWQKRAEIAESAEITALALSPDLHWLATITADTVGLYDVGVWKAVAHMAHYDAIQSIAFSPDQKLMATRVGGQCLRYTGLRPTVVRIWEVPTGKELAWQTSEEGKCNVMKKKEEQVHFPPEPNEGGSLPLVADAAHWTEIPLIGQDRPNGGRLSARSKFGELRTEFENDEIRILQSDDTLIAAMHYDSSINDIAISSDGRWMVSASDDHTVRVWPLLQKDLVEWVCARLIRNLSTDEWRRYLGEEEPYTETCPGLPVLQSQPQ
jgi:WD40 repeat protein